MQDKGNNGDEVNARMTALMTNASAVQAVTAAVAGTLGPKGLDTMLVDGSGGVIITNDGVTILDKMEISHPAASLLINVARAQQEAVGDGTTTATVMAGALVSEGVRTVAKGVPAARVIEGIRYGIRCAAETVKGHTRMVAAADEPVLRSIAMVAGREYEDIAELVLKAAGLVGIDKLCEPNFKLAEMVLAKAGAENEVFKGIIISKGRLNRDMPVQVQDARVLVIDDALEPETVQEEALGTEAGFQLYRQLQRDFAANVGKIVELGVQVVLVDRGVHAMAEEILTDAGIIVVQRVAADELRRAADHLGARFLKRTGLKKELQEIHKYTGWAAEVREDETLQHIRLVGGAGRPTATVLVGASTAEVAGERQRIARDAASSVQAAVQGGYVPGGGAAETAISQRVAASRGHMKGMSAYGVDCVVQALRRPLAQIVENAGYNPLEKVEEVLAAQTEQNSDSLAVDCDSGEVADMLTLGVVDPAKVKLHAIQAAGEVAIAILRIETIIKKKAEAPMASGSVRRAHF